MGMFDRVWVDCPICKGKIEFQSKSGDCNFNDYSLNTAPPEILGSLDGREECCRECGVDIKLSARVLVVASVIAYDKALVTELPSVNTNDY